MWHSRRELPILIVFSLYIPIFTIVALRNLNFEFVLYVGVILVVAAWILWKQRTLQFERSILWGLTVWGLLHLSGGNIKVADGVLYGVVLIPLVPRYHIFRYDQFVHMFGFGVATLVCHHLLRPYLREGITRWGTLSLLILLMGAGFGSVNEVLEFLAVLIMPETGVGGYENTMLDLTFNLLGGVLAVVWLAWRRATRSSCAGV